VFSELYVIYKNLSFFVRKPFFVSEQAAKNREKNFNFRSKKEIFERKIKNKNSRWRNKIYLLTSIQ